LTGKKATFTRRKNTGFSGDLHGREIGDLLSCKIGGLGAGSPNGKTITVELFQRLKKDQIEKVGDLHPEKPPLTQKRAKGHKVGLNKKGRC